MISTTTSTANGVEESLTTSTLNPSVTTRTVPR
jgi:hypothetical protein